MICRRTRCPTATQNSNVVRFGWGIARHRAKRHWPNFYRIDSGIRRSCIRRSGRSFITRKRLLCWPPWWLRQKATSAAARLGHKNRPVRRGHRRTGLRQRRRNGNLSTCLPCRRGCDHPCHRQLLSSLPAISVIMTSVVSIKPATLAAFCKAQRDTFVGSMMPSLIMSTYSSVAAL